MLKYNITFTNNVHAGEYIIELHELRVTVLCRESETFPTILHYLLIYSVQYML